MKYPHIMQAVFGEPWAILPYRLAQISEIVRFRAKGGKLTEDEIKERLLNAGRSSTLSGEWNIEPSDYGALIVNAAAPGPTTSRGAVAVLPLLGVISQRANLMTEMSGGTSTEKFGAAFRQAMADPSVGAVVLDVDSPGGSVYGVGELADMIRGARGQKPIITVANSMAASAAYWIATAADELVVTPGGEVGSIGVLTAHADMSVQEEMIGEKVTLISAGKKKVWANPYEPLSDEARADLQARVDDYYRAFVGAVARGRGVSASEVRGGFGEGGMVGAQEAVTLGMADRVATLEDTIRRLAGGRGGSGPARAATIANLEPLATEATGVPRVIAILDDDGDPDCRADLDLRQRRLRLAERG